MITLNQVYKKKRKKKYRRSKTPALDKCPQKSANCIKIYTTTPKKPNSAIRKVAKILLSNFKTVIAYIPGMGHTLQKFGKVLVRGGRTQDLPGVRYKLIRGKLDFLIKEGSFKRKQRRSKYGIPFSKIGTI